MRKHWVLITITIAAVLAAAAYFRFFFVFGEGVKSGELNYVVYKGVLFKTYEGKLIQTGIPLESRRGDPVLRVRVLGRERSAGARADAARGKDARTAL